MTIRKRTGKAFDVSHYQPPQSIDYPAALTDGYDLVIINFTDGVTPDPRAREHYARAKAAGLMVQPYHFVFSDPTPEDQLAAFTGATRGCEFDLPVALDIEPQSGLTRQADVLNSLTRRLDNAFDMADLLDMQAMPYTYRYALDLLLSRLPQDEPAVRWLRGPSTGLWLAHYSREPWTPVKGVPSVVMHQFTGTGRVPWYTGGGKDLDLNVYDGARMPWIVPDVQPAPAPPSPDPVMADVMQRITAARDELTAALNTLRGC